MKLLFSVLILSMFTTKPVWLTDFNKAQQQAAQNHKLILLNFSGSDWCGPCIRLKQEIFDADVFNSYASGHLLLVNADFPRLSKNQLSKEQTTQNEALADRFNKNGKFPLTILMDANGKVLKEWEGFPKESPDVFVEEIRALNAGS